MRDQNKSNKLVWLLLVGAIGIGSACNQPAPNTTVTTNVNANANSNMNVNSANVSNMNTAASTSSAIETKEPEQYQATVALKFEATGSQNVATPPLKADVARSGADRRMEFVLPNGDRLVYLDRGGKQYVIAPNRKQYAELTKEALGFEVRKLLLPEEIVNRVKTLQGVERVGEEKLDGRDVIKYRFGATTNTQTQAGTVATESIILIDKETGLPLRSQTNSQSQNGNVQGVQGINVITEMSNIKTTADANLFAEPTDFQKVEPEVVQQQVNAVFQAAMLIVGQMMKSAQPTVTTTKTP